MFSIMTTEPSTTIPKSSAPSESRFSGCRSRSRQISGEEQGKRHGDGDDDGATHIAEEEEENDDDEEDALAEVVEPPCA